MGKNSSISPDDVHVRNGYKTVLLHGLVSVLLPDDPHIFQITCLLLRGHQVGWQLEQAPLHWQHDIYFHRSGDNANRGPPLQLGGPSEICGTKFFDCLSIWENKEAEKIVLIFCEWCFRCYETKFIIKEKNQCRNKPEMSSTEWRDTCYELIDIANFIFRTLYNFWPGHI